MQNMQAFIRNHGIHFDCEWADTNPNMQNDDEWMRSASHWKCTFRKGKRRMTSYFSQGSAISREPEAADVLDSLASDANCVTGSFEDFCSDLGYDSDSRKAERTYKICKRYAGKLEKFLGSEAFEELLYKTERQ